MAEELESISTANDRLSSTLESISTANQKLGVKDPIATTESFYNTPQPKFESSGNGQFDILKQEQRRLFKNLENSKQEEVNNKIISQPISPNEEELNLKAKEKQDNVLFKSSQINLNISDESLAREGEYGMNNSTYGNTQKLVNNYQQSKALLNNPDADGNQLKDDLTLRLQNIQKEKDKLTKLKEEKEHYINKKWEGEQSYNDLAKNAKEFQKQNEQLDKTFLDLKQIYSSPEQRIKYNPLIQLVKQNGSFNLDKITPQQWDKITSDYGTTLTYLGQPENEITYLKAKHLNTLNTEQRMGYEALNSGSVGVGIAKGILGGTDEKTFQQVNRLGEMAMIDDLSKIREKQVETLNRKYDDINQNIKKATTKEEVAELKQQWDALEPEKNQIKQFTDFLQTKALEIDVKYKSLKDYEDYQKHLDYFDELNGHNNGFGTSITEYIRNIPISASSGIKQLATKLESPENQDLSSFENLNNYKWNTVQIPSYYKNTPVFEKSDISPLGFTINKSIWYNMGKTSIESLGLAGAAALSGGTSLAAEAGYTSLKGVLSGLGAASSIVVPTMIMTSTQASLDYLNQGIKPSLANDMGLITGFIEGLTEVINPIELTAPLRFTKLADRLSSGAAYKITLNNVFKEVTGKTPSKEFLKAFSLSAKEFGKEFAHQTGNEVLEEEVGLFLNGLKNQSYKDKIIGFQPGKDEEVNINNILMTAANTAITMPLLGAFGASAHIYQTHNSALPTAKFIVGQNAQLYTERLEKDFQNQAIPKEVYEAAKQEIPRLQALYKGNEFTINNLPEEDKQIRYFQLADEQQKLTKKLIASPENKELSTKLDNITETIASLQKEALINSAKTPQEKYEVAEKLMIDGINKLYTPEFLKTANFENVKKDLQKRYDFLKSPKVLEKANEILQQIQSLESKEQEKTEVVQQDKEYAKTKKEESLLNSILTKIKEEDFPSLTEEEAKYFDNNQELVKQKIQESQEQDTEDFGVANNIQRPEEVVGQNDQVNVQDKKADIEKDEQGNFIPKKYTLNLKGENPAPNIPLASIKEESFSGEMPENVKQVKLLEIRGKNSDGVTVGTAWIQKEDGQSYTIEAYFNDAELAALEQPKEEKLQETKQTTKEKVAEETKVDAETNLTPDQERQLLDQTEEDVTKTNKTSLNFVAKLTKIEEESPSEQGFVEKLLVSVWDKIAYQARKFIKKGQNLDDDLNSEYSFLNSSEITEGHELIFKLSPTNEFLSDNKKQFEENKIALLEGVLSEDEYNTILNNNDNFIQIDITDSKGRNFGSLHTIDYVREDRVVGQLEDELETGKNLRLNLFNLIEQRNKILFELRKGKTPKATITNKTIGVLSTRADKQYVDLKEAIKDKNVINTLQVVLKPNDVTVGNKPTINNKILGNMAGQVVVLLPTPQGNNFALGLKKKTLGNELASSAINAIKFFKEYQGVLTSGNVQRLQELDIIAGQIQDKIGSKYDIRDFVGLKNFISLFVYNNARTSTFTSPDNRIVKKDVPFIDFDTVNQSITFSNKRFFATKEATEEITSIEKLKDVGITRQFLFDREGKSIPLTAFYTAFEKFLSERSINIKPDLLQSEESFELPLLSDNYQFAENPRTKTTNYKEFVINNTETNVLEHKLDNNESSYFQQPTISFELKQPKTSKKKGKAKSIISTENLIQLAADKYNTTADKIVTNKRLQSTAKKLTGEKYLAKMNEEQKAEILKYFNAIKSKKEIKEEKQQTIEEQRKQNKELIDNAALHFKIDKVSIIWNSNTNTFESYNSKFDKKENSIKSLKLSNKPNVLKTWWESLASDETKDKIVNFKQNLLDLLSKSNGIVDVEPEETPEIFLMKTIAKVKFSLEDKKDLTDVSDKWFREGEKSINSFANDLLNDEDYSKGIFANFDEQEIEQIIKDVISSHPKGITKEDIETVIYENDTNSIDISSLEEDAANELGIDLETVLLKLGKQINEYESERGIKKENEEKDLHEGSSDLQETSGKSEEELDEFSFYNEEEKPQVSFNKLENYSNLALVFNSLTKEEKKNIGNLGEFINSYKETGLPITEEFLIEELNCRKNK